MAFNTLEYLAAGKVDFVYRQTTYDRDHLIELVRNANNRNEIINGFLPLLIDDQYKFCFEIIYDIEEYKDSTLYIINKYLNYKALGKDKIKNILYNTSWGKNYLIEHINEVLKDSEEVLLIIFEYIFNDLDNNYDLVKLFYLNTNLHIRYLFMNYIIVHHPELISVIYDDFTKYLTSVTYQENEQLSFFPDLMDAKDICNLAISVFNSSLDKDIWYKLKEYILENYKENYLASNLLSYEKEPLGYARMYTLVRNPEKTAEFTKDATRLFDTSKDYKLPIYLKYSELIARDILERFETLISMYQIPNVDLSSNSVLQSVLGQGLEQKLRLYTEKYLDLSKSKETGYITSGATSGCFRLGDFVIKLVQTKWSCEPIICPDLYLIIKNLEEDLIRDDKGIVLAGLEVQRYLSKSANHVSDEILRLFQEELKRLGYYSLDTFINGTCGDNCMLLDSYLDADHPNPESLPDWFKATPIVLVDRDDIYKLTNRHPRHRHSRY